MDVISYKKAKRAEELAEQIIDGTIDTGVLQTNINQKLADLEVQYAPDLSNVKSQLAEKATKTEVSLKADKTTTDNLQSQVSGLASGAPKAVSLVSQMTDTTKNYVYTGSESGYTVGNWYYHNGSTWVSGGIYQSTGLSLKSVTPEKTNFFEIPINYWTNGDITLTGSNTWKNIAYSLTSIEVGTYTFYVREALGYEPSVANKGYVELKVTNGTTNYSVKNVTISTPYFENIVIPSGYYLVVTFFLSRDVTPATTLTATFKGVYLTKTTYDEIINPKIKTNTINATPIVDLLLDENTYLLQNDEISMTRTDPTAYTYTVKTVTVEPESTYLLDIESITGNQSETLFGVELLNSSGSRISFSEHTSLSVVLLTNIDAVSMKIYFYLTYKTASTGIINYSVKKINLYKKRKLQNKYEVDYDNLSVQIKEKLDVSKTDEFLLSLPSTFYVAIGRTLEIYNKQICHCGNISNYHFDYVSTVGVPMRRKWKFSPLSSQVGNYQLTVNVYDNNLNLVTSGTTTVKVVEKPSSLAPKNMLAIGDSLTDIPDWRKELYSLVQSKYGSPLLSYIGTKGNDPLYKHEGMSGWSTQSFMSNNDYTYGGNIILTVGTVSTVPQSKKQYTIPDNQGGHVWEFEKAVGNQYYFNRITNGSYIIPTSGAITGVDSTMTGDASISFSSWTWQAGNPFWNINTNQLDFNYYLTSNGFAKPDLVSIFLGANDLGTNYGKYDELKPTFQTRVNNIKSMVDKILTQWSGTRIFIVLTPFWANQDGLGVNYGSSSSQWELQQRLKVFTFIDLVKTQFEGYNSLVSIVPVAQTMDSDNAYTMTTVPVNPRSSQTTLVATGGVHPATEGFLQIADTIFSQFVGTFTS